MTDEEFATRLRELSDAQLSEFISLVRFDLEMPTRAPLSIHAVDPAKAAGMPQSRIVQQRRDRQQTNPQDARPEP